MNGWTVFHSSTEVVKWERGRATIVVMYALSGSVKSAAIYLPDGDEEYIDGRDKANRVAAAFIREDLF